MNTPTFEHRVVDHQGRISFHGRYYQVPKDLKCGRVPMVAGTEAGIIIQTGPDSFVELLPDTIQGMNAFDGFAEKVAAQPKSALNPMLQLYADSGRKAAIEKAELLRQEAIRQAQDRRQATQQLASRTRHTVQALHRLTASVVALGRQVSPCSAQ